MIIYFSATGNSHYLAKKLSQKLNLQTLDLKDKIKNRDYHVQIENDTIIFVTPIYSWRIPRLVGDWIEKTDFLKGKKVYFIVNYGDSMGNAEKYLIDLAYRKDFDFMGVYGIQMPENYYIMFKIPSIKDCQQIVANSEIDINLIVEKISRGKKFPLNKVNIIDKFLSSIVNPIFYKFITKDKKFYSKENCISCEKCQDLCPINNIIMENGKPVWNGNCSHCMACISYCPVSAIEYGKKTKGKRRYKLEYNGDRVKIS